MERLLNQRKNTTATKQIILPTAKELSDEAKERLAKSEAFRSGTLKYASSDLTPTKKAVISDRPTASTVQDRMVTTKTTPGAGRYLADSAKTGVMQAFTDWETAANLNRRVQTDKLLDELTNTPVQKSPSRQQADAINQLKEERRAALINVEDPAADTVINTARKAAEQERKDNLSAILSVDQNARKQFEKADRQLYEDSKKQSEAVRKAGEYARSIGYMAPSMAIGGAYGGANAIGTAAMAMQSGGSGYEEARNDGARAENALRYAIGKGLLTFGTEKAMGAIPGLGKGQLDDAVETLTGKLANPWMQYLARRGIDRAGESLEEVAEEFLTPYLKRATYDANAKAASGRDLLDAAASGFVVSSILGAPADVTGARAAMQGSRAQNAGERIQSNNSLQREITLGLRNGRDTDSFKRATTLQEKIDRGELLTAQEIGELHYANQNAIAEDQAMARRDRQDRIRYSAEQAKADTVNGVVLPTARELTERIERSAEPRYSINYDRDNTPYVVVEEDILNGVPRKEWVRTVKNNLKEKFPDGIAVGNNVIKVNADTRNEYTKSEYSQNLADYDKKKYKDKMRASNNMDEIVKASRDYVNEAPKHERKNNFESFGRGKVNLQIAGKDYTADVVVGNTSGGNMVLYDVVNIQKNNADNHHIAELQKQTAIDHGDADISSISQTSENVNDNTPSVTQSQNYLPTATELIARRYGTTARESGTEVGANEAAIRMAERLSFAFDRDVVFYNRPSTEAGTENGYYQDGKIYVNVNSKNPLSEIFAHELTHSTENSELYNGLRSFVREHIPDFDKQSRAKLDEYRKQGVTLDQNGAEHELVAEFAAKKLFTNEQDIYEMALQQPRLAQRMQMWIDTALSKLGSASAADRVMLNRAKSLYADALDAASESNRQYSLSPNEDGGDEAPAIEQTVLPTAEELAAQRDEDLNEYWDMLTAEENAEPAQEFDYLEDDAAEGYASREQMEADRRRDIDEYFEMLENEAAAIANGRTDPNEMVSAEAMNRDKSIGERGREAWSYFKRKMIDSGEAVTRIGNAVRDNHLYQYYNMARASSNAGISMITDRRTDIYGHDTGKGLNEIFEPIKDRGTEYYNKFQLYLLHLHNVDRMSRHNQEAIDHARQAFENFRAGEPELARFADYQIEEMALDQNSDYFIEAREYVMLRDLMRRAEHTQNVPVFGYDITADISRDTAAELLREHPEFEELSRDVYAYIDNLLQYRVDSGLIRAEDVQYLKSIYPHYVPTYREFENDMPAQRNTRDTIIGSTIGRATGGTQGIMPLHKALAQQTLSVVREGSKNRFGVRLLQDSVRNRDAVSEEVRHVQEYENDFHEDTFDDNEPDQFARTNTFVVRQNGRMYEMTVSPALYEAVEALSPNTKEANAFTKFVRKGNDLYKKLITAYNPMFVGKNFVRDLQDAGLYSKNLSEFVRAYPEAIREIATNGQYWQQYKALGGTYSSIFDYETGNVNRPNRVVGRVEALNQAVEQAPRLAEFIATVRTGDGSMDNLMEAMYNAADITTNFGRSGTLGKVLNANYIPFLNPSIQGFDKMVRTITETKGGEAWAKLILKAAALGMVPTIINELLYGDDEEWDELRDSDKDTNYMFKIGDSKWLKIPKGRAISLLGMTADRSMDVIQGEKVDLGSTLETAASQTAPTNPLKENILKAWFDADLLDPESPGQTWYGSDIESQRLQGYAPGERYDNTTDEFSKFVGRTLNLSPKKINYLLNQYLGVVADIALPLMTPANTKSVGSLLTSGVTVDSVASNKLSNDFYTTMDDLTYAKNAPEATGVDEVVYRYWNKQKTTVNEVNAAIREIEVDKSLSNADRQDLIRAQYAIRNQLERNALDLLDDYTAAAEKYYNSSNLQDEDDKIAYAYREANREIYGAEYALQVYNKDVYAKAQKLHDQGMSYDDYYDMYFEMKEAKAQHKGYQRSNAIRNIIAGAPVSENAKKSVYRDEFSDSRDDDIEAFKDAGLSFNKYLVVQNKYAQINEEVEGASNKALELARWVEQQGFDEDAAATIKQSFMYYSQIPAQTNKYDAMMGLDMEDESAAEVLSAISALEPLEGKTSVSDKQKYQAIIDTNLTYNEKLRAFEVYMNESAYEKLNEAVESGIDMEDYITYVIDTADIKADKDANGKTVSGSKKSKILEYINSMPISSSQKDTLYLMAGYSEKTIDETPWYGSGGSSGGSIFSSRGGNLTFGNRSSGSSFANRGSSSAFADRGSNSTFADRGTSSAFGNRNNKTSFR